MRATRLVIALAALAGLAVVIVWYAGQRGAPDPGPGAPADPTPAERQVTLYFPDDQAQFLVPEQRTVTGEGDVAAAIVTALIAGPETEGLFSSIPPGARLLGIQRQGAAVVVDFSRQFQTEHWGGSTGEIMTLYSLANSLTEVADIDRVFLTLEGEPLQTLAGHVDLQEGLQRNEQLIAPSAP